MGCRLLWKRGREPFAETADVSFVAQLRVATFRYLPGFSVAPNWVQCVQVAEKKLFDATKSESFTGFSTILLISKTNSRIPRGPEERRNGGPQTRLKERTGKSGRIQTISGEQ